MGNLQKQVLLDVDSGSELVMPVYAMAGGPGWSHGKNVETLYLDQLGDLNIPTTRKLCEQPLELLLPARAYPFCVPGAVTDPWYYIEQLERRCDANAPQRYIVTGTPINALVIIQTVRYTEPDGSGDLTATVTLREYQTPAAIPTEADTPLTVGAGRESQAAAQTRQYTVVKGDCMWSIARDFYGDGSLCYRLAAANGIKNADLIYPGTVLTLPPLDALPPAGERAKSEQLAGRTKALYDYTQVRWTMRTPR